MAAVRITDVVPAFPADGRLEGSIDEPEPGTEPDGYAFIVSGSVVVKSDPISSVEIRTQGRLVVKAGLTPETARIASTQPGPTDGHAVAFRATVSALELRAIFELLLIARLKDGAAIPIGHIRGSRRTLPPNPDARIQPAMLTTIGRSGSKWLIWLLSCHPQVAAYDPLVFEPRVATYWMAVLRALASPRSFLRQVHNEAWEENWWLGGAGAELPAPLDAHLAGWLGRDAVESLASMCQMRIEEFYAEVGEAVGERAPDYFAEKFLLEPVAIDLMKELYPAAKELILVRDFRDRLSSVLAWDAKRGTASFGREQFTTDTEYVTSRLRTEALSLLRHWRERAHAAHLVRYEDLVLEPRRTLAELLRYLEIDSSDELVRATVDRASQETTLLDAHRTVGDASASIGRWHEDLSPELADLCNETLGEVLAEFGYSTDAREALSDGT
jgi:Sulfotransferase family